MSLLKKLAEKALATLGQRGQENGYDKKPGSAQEERSAAQIARVFNELTGHQLTTTDAWTFLQVLKLVRMETQIKMGSGDLLDSCIDMIGYSLLKAETALQEHRPAQIDTVLKKAPETAQERLAKARSVAMSSAECDGVPLELSGVRPGRRVDTGNHPVLSSENIDTGITDAEHVDDRR